ncbi:NmrA family transcriptional regulator [bacterium]|nr:MAG: NmrA family transcriptional regulator [bacterium]
MIVVTTPTGDIGHQVVENLLHGNESIRVIARKPSQLSAAVRERVEIVEGSHGDPTIIDEALAGADSLFWLPPPYPQAPSLEAAYSDFARPACAAIQKHGVKRVVSVSALGRGTELVANAGFVTATIAMDELIASTGTNLRALAMPSFMENVLRQTDSIKNQGLLFSSIDPDRKAPTCATRDIAATAAKFLLDHSWTGQESAAVLGPEDLSFNEMAQIISEVLGKPVRCQYVPAEASKDRLREMGMSDAYAQGYIDMMVAKNHGLDNAEPRTPESSTPTSFRQWCEEVLKPAIQG